MTEQEVRQKLETVQLKMAHLKGTIDRAKADYQSGKEAHRYVKLKLMQRAGLIRNMKMQVSYDIHVNGILICRYVADFVYLKGQKEIVEDAKGKRLPMYMLKKKLMLAVLGIKIQEV